MSSAAIVITTHSNDENKDEKHKESGCRCFVNRNGEDSPVRKKTEEEKMMG